MSKATVYSGAQFGLVSEISATGLYIGTISWDGTSEQAVVPDHIGTTVGVSIYNPTKEVSLDGVIAVKGTGLVGSIGETLALSNSTNLPGGGTRTRLSEGLGATPVSGAALIITGNNIAPSNTEFETGSLSASFWPGINTGSVYEVT